VTFLLFEGICFAILSRFFNKKISLPNYIKSINIIIEVALSGILLFLLITLEEPLIFLDPPLMSLQQKVGHFFKDYAALSIFR